MRQLNPNNALVVLSGGMDSTISLFAALRRRPKGGQVHAITFDYGQRHRVEVDAAGRVVEIANDTDQNGGVASHRIVDLGYLLSSQTGFLTRQDAKPDRYASLDDYPEDAIDAAYVYGRNLLFITLAAAAAAEIDAGQIYLGVCQTDASTFPDCTEAFIDSAENTLAQAGFEGLRLVTPVIDASKAQEVAMAKSLGDGCWRALSMTVSDYSGSLPPDPLTHPSLARADGFHQAREEDPMIVRLIEEEILPPAYPRNGWFSRSTGRAILDGSFDPNKDEQDVIEFNGDDAGTPEEETPGGDEPAESEGDGGLSMDADEPERDSD